MKNIPSWLLDLNEFKKHFGKNYVDKIMEFVEELFRDPEICIEYILFKKSLIYFHNEF